MGVVKRRRGKMREKGDDDDEGTLWGLDFDVSSFSSVDHG